MTTLVTIEYHLRCLFPYHQENLEMAVVYSPATGGLFSFASVALNPSRWVCNTWNRRDKEAIPHLAATHQVRHWGKNSLLGTQLVMGA